MAASRREDRGLLAATRPRLVGHPRCLPNVDVVSQLLEHEVGDVDACDLAPEVCEGRLRCRLAADTYQSGRIVECLLPVPFLTLHALVCRGWSGPKADKCFAVDQQSHPPQLRVLAAHHPWPGQ